MNDKQKSDKVEKYQHPNLIVIIQKSSNLLIIYLQVRTSMLWFVALTVAIRASDHLSTTADSAVATDVPFAMLPL